MKPLKPKNIKTLGENDTIYVSRGLINATMAKLVTARDIKDDDTILLLKKIISDAVDEEYRTKRIIPYIKMTIRDVKKCFPEYMDCYIGAFFK